MQDNCVIAISESSYVQQSSTSDGRFCREYDRLEADAVKLHCKPKYFLASTDHEALVKSTVDLACNPKLKGKVPSAIKEVLAHGAALEELIIGMASSYTAAHGSEWVMQAS